MAQAIASNSFKVLILQNDYFQALDLAVTLQSFGASILRLCSNEADAIDLLQRETPTHAVLGLDFGDGPSFEVAFCLKNLGIPFVFLTGWNLDVIPPDLKDIPCMLKPAAPWEVAKAVATLPKCLSVRVGDRVYTGDGIAIH